MLTVDPRDAELAAKETDDRGLPGAIMDELWPILGGDMLPGDMWHDIDRSISEAIAAWNHRPEPLAGSGVAGELVADLEMACELIQEAKGVADGLEGGLITNNLDSAEHWINKVQNALRAHPAPEQSAHCSGEVVEVVARALYDCEKERSDHVDRLLSAAKGQPVKFHMEHWNDAAEVYRSDARAVLAAIAALSAPRPDEGVESHPSIVTAIGGYGGRCRDCADMGDGVCENRGLPCGERKYDAIRHVLRALAYYRENPHFLDQIDPLPIAALTTPEKQP
jgi:hypothetical protein